MASADPIGMRKPLIKIWVQACHGASARHNGEAVVAVPRVVRRSIFYIHDIGFWDTFMSMDAGTFEGAKGPVRWKVVG